MSNPHGHSEDLEDFLYDMAETFADKARRVARELEELNGRHASGCCPQYLARSPHALRREADRWEEEHVPCNHCGEIHRGGPERCEGSEKPSPISPEELERVDRLETGTDRLHPDMAFLLTLVRRLTGKNSP